MCDTIGNDEGKPIFAEGGGALNEKKTKSVTKDSKTLLQCGAFPCMSVVESYEDTIESEISEMTVVCFVTDGSGVCRVLESDIPCRKGDVCIIPPSVPHMFFFSDTDGQLMVRQIKLDIADWFSGEITDKEKPDYCYGVFTENPFVAYQTVTVIEDSFDFEGMAEARKKTYPLSQSLRGIFKSKNISKVLHLGAGGCGVCSTCAKQTDEPCRFPDIAMPSLESYGINVSKLAKSANMKYTNGQDTVTYFGAVLFRLKGQIRTSL